jgi:hypothetical protein
MLLGFFWFFLFIDWHCWPENQELYSTTPDDLMPPVISCTVWHVCLLGNASFGYSPESKCQDPDVVATGTARA